MSGIRMLVHQAAYQFELYTGKRVSFEVMEEALLERVGHLWMMRNGSLLDK